MILPEVRLGAYPTRIPDAALDRLRVLVERHAVPRAPRFAAWMLDLIDDERVRRLHTRRGSPREPGMTVVPVSLWSNTEIGEAIIVAHAIGVATTDHAARGFLAYVNTAILALAARRLERSDLTKGGSK